MNATDLTSIDQDSDRRLARAYIFRRISFESTGCWTWLGPRIKIRRENGRTFLPYGECHRGNKRWKAHRLAWYAFRGEIPTGLKVCHQCDNAICCNPWHLFLGTQAQNAQDCSRKGRTPVGTKHPKAILNDDLVRKMRSDYIPKVVTMRMLMNKYGVAIGLVSDVLTRKRWNHVT